MLGQRGSASASESMLKAPHTQTAVSPLLKPGSHNTQRSPSEASKFMLYTTWMSRKTDGKGCAESLELGPHLIDRVVGGKKPSPPPSHLSLLHPPLSFVSWLLQYQSLIPITTTYSEPDSLALGREHWRAEAAAAPQGRFPAEERGRAGLRLGKPRASFFLFSIYNLF